MDRDLQMRPSAPAFNPANGVLVYAIVCCYFFLKARISSNLQNLLFSKFCGGTSLASVGCSVLYAIRLVVCGGVPSEICKAIILRIPIVVTTFMTRFRVASKCAQDNPSNAPKFVFVFFPQQNSGSAIFFINCWLFYFPRFYCSYAPDVRNFIQPFKPRNWLPNFCRHLNIPVTVDMGILL